MGKLIDLTGMRFGRLTVVSRSKEITKNHKRVYWDCICDCGKQTSVDGWNLRSGYTKSCGCLFQEVITKHGDHDAPLYKVWHGMKARCNNQNSTAFRYYGARGISVCDEWSDYLTFKEWAISNGYRQGLAIDRIDSNKNYCPENCRWITPSENSIRTARNLLTVAGETLSYKQWEKKIGMGKMSIEHWVERHGEQYAIQRIDATINPQKYSSEEVERLGINKNKRRYLTINDRTMSFSAWSREIGFSHHTVSNWVNTHGEDYAIEKITFCLEKGRK